jgi:hypothetical protein
MVSTSWWSRMESRTSHPVTVVRDYAVFDPGVDLYGRADQVIVNPPVDLTDGHKVNVQLDPPA